MLILALVVLGSAGYLRLGVDRFPSVDLPTVRVSTRLPGASPAEVEAQISQPIEEVINTIEGIKELRSVNGSAFLVIVTFELDREIDAAAQDVRDQVATVIRELPREADPPVISKADNDLSPVMTIALSGERSLRELTEIADKIVKVQWSARRAWARWRSSAGWSGPSVSGSMPTGWRPIRFPSPRCGEAISRQNANVPGGFVTLSPARAHPAHDGPHYGTQSVQ